MLNDSPKNTERVVMLFGVNIAKAPRKFVVVDTLSSSMENFNHRDEENVDNNNFDHRDEENEDDNNFDHRDEENEGNNNFFDEEIEVNNNFDHRGEENEDNNNFDLKDEENDDNNLSIDDQHNEIESDINENKNNIIDTSENSKFDSGQSSNQEKVRKVKPWTKEEHKAFLRGLQHFGKGKWKDIAKEYVISKTYTQVASHAQKYFNKNANAPPTKKRKPSVFNVTLEDMEIEISKSVDDSSLLRPSSSNSQ